MLRWILYHINCLIMNLYSTKINYALLRMRKTQSHQGVQMCAAPVILEAEKLCTCFVDRGCWLVLICCERKILRVCWWLVMILLLAISITKCIQFL